MTQSGPSEWTVEHLQDRIARQDSFFVLDVRNRDEFENARIEGRSEIPTRNVPYFEMLESDRDDLVASIADFVGSSLTNELPKEMPLLTVCAKGGTSQLVAQALDHLGYRVSNLAGGMAAWNDYYDAHTAAEDELTTIVQISRPARGCLSYLIVSDGRAAVVDPLRHLNRYLRLAKERQATIEIVIDTHGHADHVSGGRALASIANAPYYLHPYDAIHPIDMLPAKVAYEPLRDNQPLSLGRTQIQPIWIPGHTLGNIALLVNGTFLLTGDSIFVRSIARPDLGGRAEAWTPLHYESIRRLLELPPSTLVLPGHFSRPDEANPARVFAATLEQLRSSNDGVIRALGSADSFKDYIIASLPHFPPEYVDIKRVNAGLLTADDERLAEMESGKNLCAMAR